MTKDQEKQILDWYSNVIQYNCLRAAIRFFKQGQEQGASKLLYSEQDKLRIHPELVELLKESFPTYRELVEKAIKP